MFVHVRSQSLMKSISDLCPLCFLGVKEAQVSHSWLACSYRGTVVWPTCVAVAIGVVWSGLVGSGLL